MLSFSLLGGLGIDPLVSAEAGVSTQLAPSPAPQLAPPAPGECTSDGKQIWIGPTSTAPGHWAALPAGAQCATIGEYIPTVTVHPSGEVVLVPPSPAARKMIKVGPFMVPYEAQQFVIHWTGAMPADWQAFINQEIAHDCSGCISSSMRSTAPQAGLPDLRQWLGSGVPAQVNSDFFSGSMFSDTKVNTLKELMFSGDVSNQNPIVFVKHPDNGDDYGFYIWIDRQDPMTAWDPVKNKYVLMLVWRKIERHWYTDAWNWIAHLVGEIVEAIGNMACSLVCTPAATQAALKSLVAAGPAVAAAGIVGDAIAVGLCSCPLTPAALAPIPPKNYTGWVIAGFAAMLGLGAILYRQSQ